MERDRGGVGEGVGEGLGSCTPKTPFENLINISLINTSTQTSCTPLTLVGNWGKLSETCDLSWKKFLDSASPYLPSTSRIHENDS